MGSEESANQKKSWPEPVLSAIEKINNFAKSSENLVKSMIPTKNDSPRSDPIEILKRLQREAFSDLMKLRDRQDKVERMLSFYKSNKGGPFQEANTHMRGEINVVGASLLKGDINQQTCESLRRSGIRPGIDSRFIFETTVREKDSLVTEFVTKQTGGGYHGDDFGNFLALAKVMYLANISDWFSLIAIPVGARAKDIGALLNPLLGQGLAEFSAFGPPIFSRHHSFAVGATVKRSNITASLAELVSGLYSQPESVGTEQHAETDAGWHSLSTFGQVIYQPSEGMKFTLSGLYQMPKSPAQGVGLPPLVVPVIGLKPRLVPVISLKPCLDSGHLLDPKNSISTGMVALMLESEVEESTKISGWIQMQKSSQKSLQWAVSVTDNLEEEFGWGLGVGGAIQAPSTWVRTQLEAFLNFNLGKRFKLQPALVYSIEQNMHTPAFIFRSSWSL